MSRTIGLVLLALGMHALMATVVKSLDPSEPLVRVVTYMYPKDRQRVREQASRRGMAMSEYVKWLVDRDCRGLFEEGR